MAFSSSTSSSSASPAVESFLKKSIVQQALEREGDQHTPRTVLGFFYGVDIDDASEVEHQLAQGHALEELSPLWFGGGTVYDHACTTFKEAVRLAGTRQLTSSEWNDTVHGLMAQLILCDQLSRNAFRGEEEAFAYDEAAIEYATRLSQHVLQSCKNEGSTTNSNGAASSEANHEQALLLEGTVHPPFISNIITCLMHSENIQHHNDALALLNVARSLSPESCQSWWDNQEAFELEHKHVLDRFGRYPHRNSLKGRTNTPEEDTWLANEDELPGWAKSQIK